MKKLLLAVAAAAFSLAAAPSFAQTAPAGDTPGACDATSCTDADLHVTVTITGNCDYIEVGDIDFGTFPVSSGDKDQTTLLSVRCNTGQAYTIGLDNGVNPANATSPQRNVVSGTGGVNINYKLYSDAARTTEWNDTTTGGTAAQEVSGTGTSAIQDRTVYGRLTLAGQAPGTYTDLVTATLKFP